MELRKCCIPDCSITATALLIDIIDKNNIHSVCPQHITAFIYRFTAKQPLDSYENVKSFEYKCSFCHAQAKYQIQKGEPFPKNTFLCMQHVKELIDEMKDNVISSWINKHFCTY